MPDDVVVLRAVDRQPAEPLLDRQIERLRHRRLVRDHRHVGPRHHHLADDGVAELDDALDQLALVVLDHVVGGSGSDRCRAAPVR